MHKVSQNKKKKSDETPARGVAKLGSIEGTAVSDILLDTGCSRTLVRKESVPKEKLLDDLIFTCKDWSGDT